MLVKFGHSEKVLKKCSNSLDVTADNWRSCKTLFYKWMHFKCCQKNGRVFKKIWPSHNIWTLCTYLGKISWIISPHCCLQVFSLKILSLTSMWLRFLGNRPVPWMYWSLLVSNLTSVRASMPSKAPSSRVSMSQWDRAKVVTKRKWLKAPLLQKTNSSLNGNGFVLHLTVLCWSFLPNEILLFFFQNSHFYV